MADETGGTAAPDSSLAPAGTAATATPPASAPPASASVLGTGAPPAGQGTPGQAPPQDPNAWLPEKLRVLGEDGKTLNLDASARKLAEAYA
ncbi:MAG: hypothetical protein ACRC1H_03250, partial [Caldilineaceae bacterium]